MPYLNKEYTKKVRQELRSRYPEFKFSVTTRHHSTLSVKILSGPLDLGVDSDGYDQVNHFHVEKHYEDYPEARDFLTEVLGVMSQDYDSCVHTDGDYGNIPNFYLDLQIGKWDKPYKTLN